MGMVTLHLVIGVGVFILPLFLLLFVLVSLSLAHLYIVVGAVSFVAAVLTAVVLVTKFVNQPEAHGCFSYSDVFGSALMSLGLTLDGILFLLPDVETPCYQYKLVYGLFVLPIVTGFFSILGAAIERFQMFALYRDRRRLTKKFSVAWMAASWALGEKVLENNPANLAFCSPLFPGDLTGSNIGEASSGRGNFVSFQREIARKISGFSSFGQHFGHGPLSRTSQSTERGQAEQGIVE